MSLTMETTTVQAVLTGTVVGGKGYGISHCWDGTVLTVTSDSGSSSADLVGPRGDAAEKMLVTVTQNDDGSYTADRSFEEIAAAVENGELPAARLVGAAGERYGQTVSYAAERMVQFSGWLHSGILDASMVITISAADEVSITYPAEPKAESVSAVKADGVVTVTVAYDDLSISETVITLDENGDPISVAKDGVVCALRWEGFDE